MKFIALLVSVLLSYSTLSVQAQIQCNNEWAAQIKSLSGGGFGNDQPKIATDLDGNTILSAQMVNVDSVQINGQTFTEPQSTLLNTGFIISKFDTLGNLIWFKAINGIGQNHVYDLEVDDDNSVYISGGISTELIIDGNAYLGPNTGTAFFIIKINDAGVFQWIRKADYQVSSCFSVEWAGNSLLFSIGFSDSLTFAGQTFYDSESNLSGNFDFLIGKLNKNGGIVSTSLIGGTGSMDIRNIKQLGSGCLIQGRFENQLIYDSDTLISPAPGHENLYQLFLDQNYDMVWSNQSVNPLYTFFWPIGIAWHSGDFLYSAGYYEGSFSMQGHDFGNSEGRAIFLTRQALNDGHLDWGKLFDGDGGEFSEEILATDNGCLMSGYFGSASILLDTGSLNNSESGSFDSFTLVIDSSGNTSCGMKIGGLNDQRIRSIAPSGEKVNLLLNFNGALDFNGSLYFPGGNDLIVLSTCVYCKGTTNIKLVEQKQGDIKIYPNPFTNQTTVKLANPLQNGTLQLHDDLGRLVRNEPIAGNEFTLQQKGLPAGVYFMSIFDGAEKLGSWRVAVGE